MEAAPDPESTPAQMGSDGDPAPGAPLTHRESSNALLIALQEIASTAVLTIDAEGRIVSWPAQAEEITGYTAREFLGRRLRVWYASDKIAAGDPDRALRDAASTGRSVLEGWRARKDGTRIWAHEVFVPRRSATDQVTGYVAVLQDLTLQKRTAEALRLSEARFRLLVEESEAIFFYTIDLGGQIAYVSPAVRSVTGYEAEELLGRSFTVFGSRGLDDPVAARQHIKDRIDRQLSDGDQPVRVSTRLRHKDGHPIDLELVESLYRSGTSIEGIQGYARDVTAERQLEEQLRHQALHDPLTGLPNRALFEDRLEHAAELAQRRASHHFAVMTIDLDRFKLVNDSFGHYAGDLLLTAVAKRIERSVRPGDTVARFGGDEFTVLLDEVGDANDATRIADRIISELAAPFVLDTHEVFASASMGIALSIAGYERSDDLMRNADTALYHAKATSRGRYEVFDRAMHERTRARLRMETSLRHAVERRELRIAYQSIIDVATGRIAAFEALARWPRDSRGEFTPSEFVPVAEDTGIIVDLDRWMLERACRQLAVWQARRPERPLAMNVNISGKLLAQPRLAEEIRALLEQEKVAPAALRLEITESVLIGRATPAHLVLDQLHDLGVRLQLDDFGTGYSSLSNLNRFPFDGLKLDRSLVRDDVATAKIMRAVVMLARSMDLAVVAEGVERAEQLVHLRALGCEYAQGYYISPPLYATDAEALLEQDPQW